MISPRFESGDPTYWLYKVRKYFEYHRTSEDGKLPLAILHLDGAAPSWFRWLQTNRQVRSWQEFVFQMQARFGPSPYDGPSTQLFRLYQSSTIEEYEYQRHKITNKIPGLPDSYLKRCNMGGLRWDSKKEVIADQPYNLQHAIGHSQLHKGKAEFSNHYSFNPRMQQTFRPTSYQSFAPSYNHMIKHQISHVTL